MSVAPLPGMREATPSLAVIRVYHKQGSGRYHVELSRREHSRCACHARNAASQTVRGIVLLIAALLLMAPSASAQDVRSVDRVLLSGAFVAQMLDAHSTQVALSRPGVVEANPLLGPVASRPAALWALKVGAAAATYHLKARLFRSGRHKTAIALAVGEIVAYGIIAHHNYGTGNP